MTGNKGYGGTRVRFQRVRDARFFGGWTARFDGRQIVVKLGSSDTLIPGDMFFFQLYGSKKCSLFPAECVSVAEDFATFTVTRRPRMVDSAEEVRIKPRFVTCYLNSAFGGNVAEVLDVSPNGLAILVPFAFQKGETTELTIDTPRGTVCATGVVQNCRQAPDRQGYRVGFSLAINNRTMQGRWRNLFFEVA